MRSGCAKDPYGRATERRPSTASLVVRASYQWGDERWLSARRRARLAACADEHLRGAPGLLATASADGSFYGYRELAAELIPYVKELGFTHLELMPITEHPLDDSWGYQTTGYFAPTSRYGSPDELRFFVDQCHRNGIGVLLDWVPGHFPRDTHALANFDGTALYEYHDPRKAEHRDWGTLIFNYERHEVCAFLLSSALYWLEEFHFDGLRVDAVASMLYLDFGRGDDYVRNRFGGRHNLEAMEFLRSLNRATHERCPGTVVIAEESTDWPLVSRPTDVGGFGFSMKWNMGWMHDTLGYFREDPINRSHHHNKLTFGMMYAYSENFVLPLSHDEVVHLKRSLLGRMPGDRWQQLANLRLLYAYMWTFPGKKLLFMGGEFAHPWEWNFRTGLPWWLTGFPEHAGIQKAVADLNRLYVSEPALHRFEFEPGGFAWIELQRCGQLDLELPAHGRRAASGHRAEFYPGAPRRLPHRRTSEWALPGAVQFRFGLLRRQQPRHCGRRRSEPHSPGLGQPCSLVVTLPPLGALVLAPA